MVTLLKNSAVLKSFVIFYIGLVFLSTTSRGEFDLDTLDQSMEKIFNSTKGVQGNNKALGNAIKAVRITEVALVETTKVMKQMDWVKCFNAMSKALTALGPTLMVASAILGIVCAFMPQQEDPQLKFLRESFDEVNFKLDGISTQLYSMEQSILTGQAKIMVVPAIHTIDSLEEELMFALSQKTRTALLYFAQTYYTNNNFAVERLWNFLNGQNSTTNDEYHIDFLTNVQKSSLCSQMSLTRVCLKGIEEINKGIVQEATYFGVIRYPQRVKYLPNYWKHKQDQLRNRCIEKLQQCEDEYEHWATKTIENFYNEHIKELSPKAFSEGLYSRLHQQYPFRSWAVFTSLECEIGEFQCTYHSPYKFFEKLNLNNRNVIVTDRPRYSDSKIEAVKTMSNDLGVSVKYAYSCGIFSKGPLYYSDSKYLVEEMMQVAPKGFIAAGPLNIDAHLSTSKEHMTGYTYFKSLCLSKNVRLLVAE